MSIAQARLRGRDYMPSINSAADLVAGICVSKTLAALVTPCKTSQERVAHHSSPQIMVSKRDQT